MIINRNYYLIGMITVNSHSLPLPDLEAMPQKKPLDEHKQQMCISLEPSNSKWVRERYKELGYRSVSHLIDGAIGLFRKEKGREGRE